MPETPVLHADPVPYSLYLARPEVFLPNALEVVDEQRRICRGLGLIPISPLDKGDGPGDQTVSRQDRIFAGNIALIERADAIVANIQPFRGPDPDAGTAFEVGYAHALGKPIYLWSTDTATNAQRVERHLGPLHRHADGMLADRDDLMVEDFGGPVNLMLVSPATVVLGSFESCIRRVAEDVDVGVCPCASVSYGMESMLAAEPKPCRLRPAVLTEVAHWLAVNIDTQVMPV